VCNRPVRWSWLLAAVLTVVLTILTVHAPIESVPLELSPPNSRPIHCTAHLTAGVRIHLGAGPMACAFDPIDDNMYCGTTSGEIVKVCTDRQMVLERWKVTDGQVTGLSFLTHKLGTPANGFTLHGIVAYIDTLRGLMMWDTREHHAPPGYLPAELATHHSSWLATAPIEGGIFYTLPCGQKHQGHIPDKEHIIQIALSARPSGKLMHLLPHHNSTSELASDLFFPTALAVPFTEDFALVLEPLAYRVVKVSLEARTLGVKSDFLSNLPAFPCAVTSSDQYHVRPDFWIGLCGDRRSPWLDWLHRHPLVKNWLGWAPHELLDGLIQTPTPHGHLMLVRADAHGRVKEVLCDHEEPADGLIPHTTFLLQHAGVMYVGSPDYEYLLVTNKSKMDIFPARPSHDDL